jgi:Complex I intermediate-associated protein 30 (CIA30)
MLIVTLHVDMHVSSYQYAYYVLCKCCYLCGAFLWLTLLLLPQSLLRYYCCTLQPKDMAQANEFQYQTSFDTVAGQWITVDLPFEAFVAVRRNDVIFTAPKVNAGPAGTQMSR